MFDSAVIEKLREVEIADGENQTHEIDLIVLKGGFSTSDHQYNFEIKSDGTSDFFYLDFDDQREEFAHEVKVEKLAAEIEEVIREQMAQSEQNAPLGVEVENIREETVSEMLEEGCRSGNRIRCGWYRRVQPLQRAVG
jgi:hypothetical protein